MSTDITIYKRFLNNCISGKIESVKMLSKFGYLFNFYYLCKMYTQNSNKIVLKIQFIGKYKLKLTLIYLDKRFLGIEGGKFLYFKSKINEFYIYSRSYLNFQNYSLRLPDSKHYNPSEFVIRNFIDEEERKLFLERLYQSLLEWGNNFVDFKKDNNKQIKLEGEYWIL